MITLQKLKVPAPGLDTLLAEALAEGFGFVQTLADECASGENLYDRPGELLQGAFDGEQLVAVGGLNIDPFAGRADMARIRRVYVRRAWRNAGLGRALVSSLVEQARTSFHCVRLRAENADAARLYERMGFVPVDGPHATHILLFEPPSG
jgi:GNAT superfamily N-acetyltransferase